MTDKVKNTLVYSAIGLTTLAGGAYYLNSSTPEESSTTVAYEDRDYDCADFSSHEEAQEFFESQGPGDPHRLDRDGDGYACELN